MNDTERKIKSYDGNGITVTFEAARCYHAKECVRGLPEVFDIDKRPWIQPEHASTEAIIDAVEQCPTGALRYRHADGRPPRPVSETTVAFPVHNGPLVLRGRTQVLAQDGTTFTEEDRLALCRCGNSGNQPFCDNAHRRVAFEARPPTPTTAAESPDDRCPPQDEAFG